MKKFIFTLGFLAYCIASLAQYTSPEEIADYKKRAENGSIAAMGYLADMYAAGEVAVPKDCNQALKYYNMAIEKGDSSCMVNLGRLYLSGDCVTADYTKAEKLFTMAAEKGNTFGYFNIGFMYEAGIGKAPGYNKALEWYFKTAEQGKERVLTEGSSVEGGYILFNMLAHMAHSMQESDLLKNFQRIDTAKTFNAFADAAAKGNNFAMLAISNAYMSGDCTQQDTSKALYWMEKAADAGNVYAMYRMGIRYYEKGDFPGPRDNAVAAKWFLKSAQAGYIDGMTHIAIVYYYGRGLPQDYKKAMDWHLKAAAKGNGLAMNNIGLSYLSGEGVKQDSAKAFSWFLKAATVNYANSMFYLAMCYDKGIGTPQDYKKAMEWYLKAAENGNERAMDGIGKLYEDGKGVPQSNTKAIEWYAKKHH